MEIKTSNSREEISGQLAASQKTTSVHLTNDLSVGGMSVKQWL